MAEQYSLEPLDTLPAQTEYLDFVQLYDPDILTEVDETLNSGLTTHMVACRETGVGTLIGVLGINHIVSAENFTNPTPTQQQMDDGYYEYYYFVVDGGSPAHFTNIAQGAMASGLYLVWLQGASWLRNQKEDNSVPHSFFTDAYFIEVYFNDDKPYYKWTYLLDVDAANADPVKWARLELFWGQYDIIT